MGYRNWDECLEYYLSDDQVDQIKGIVCNSEQQLDINKNLALFGKFSKLKKDKNFQRINLSFVEDGWNKSDVTPALLGRLFFLSKLNDLEINYVKTIQYFFERADLNESIALYSSLSILKCPTQWLNKASDGLRSNMQPIFESVALENPYPFLHFSIDQWNQMVLKAIYLDSKIQKIHKLDQRMNDDLSEMFINFAQERISAGRDIPVSLWYCLSKCISIAIILWMGKVVKYLNKLERRGLLLALENSKEKGALKILSEYEPEVKDWQHQKLFNWNALLREIS